MNSKIIRNLGRLYSGMGRGRYGEFIKTKYVAQDMQRVWVQQLEKHIGNRTGQSFAYIGHIVERRRKVLGVRKTISILRSARRGKQDFKPSVVVLYLILVKERALRATRNVCELKICLDHIVSNTRCYSPSAAVAACSCGGPAGSVLPVLSSARHRIPYWSGRIDVATIR